MSSTRRPRAKLHKKLLIGVVLLLVVAAIAAYLFNRHQNSSLAKQPRDASTEAQVRETEENKQKSDARTDENKGQTGNSNTTTKVSVVINRAGQQGAGTPLNVRATVTGISSGNCEITLTRSGQSPVTHSFPISISGTSATCGSADIPAADFPTSGDWKLQLVAAGRGETSEAATATVKITK